MAEMLNVSMIVAYLRHANMMRAVSYNSFAAYAAITCIAAIWKNLEGSGKVVLEWGDDLSKQYQEKLWISA